MVPDGLGAWNAGGLRHLLSAEQHPLLVWSNRMDWPGARGPAIKRPGSCACSVCTFAAASHAHRPFRGWSLIHESPSASL